MTNNTNNAQAITNFFQRNRQWLNKSRIRQNLVSQDIKQKELRECTFRPTLNPKSQKLV
jgi:hypothetical protein